MSDIAKIDKNFEIKTDIQKDDIVFYSIDEAPFKIFGILKEGGKYRRMPEDVAKNVNEGVYRLHQNTAGGRVRFKTDSNFVAIKADMEETHKMPHCAFTGSIGFDLYIDDVYNKTFVPPLDIQDGYESIIEFGTNELREITINFPLYSNVKDLYIGIQEKATVKEPEPYKNTKPIVYYGSSITQGACASRPGMSYQAIISRRFNYDYINLGFSGSAKGEVEIQDYIKNLDMSLFVYDYDYNAPSAQHLQETHERMFKAIREKNPELPIIMMSRPSFYLNSTEKERLKIIENTYNNAVSSGDKNVYLITGKKLTELCGNDGTVDSAHPTDFGFVSIAKALGDVIENINCI